MSNEEKMTLEKRAPVLKEAIEQKNQEVAQRISHAYAEASRSLSNALGHTICAGLLMIERKVDLPHGEFLPWLERYCPEIHRATATRFMNAAQSAVTMVLGPEAAKLQMLHDATFDGAPLHQILTADPAILTKSARDVQNQFREFLQGKTQHQLLLDWKEIKDKTKERKPPQQPTAEEAAEAERKAADENLTQLAADIELFVLSGTTLQFASDKVLEALLEKGIEMNNRLRATRAEAKSKPAKRARK